MMKIQVISVIALCLIASASCEHHRKNHHKDGQGISRDHDDVVERSGLYLHHEIINDGAAVNDDSVSEHDNKDGELFFLFLNIFTFTFFYN